MTRSDIGQPVDVDVVVVGAGGCGLAAALAASERGASVAVLEKMDAPGGNTALSTGSIPAAGSRYQAAAGILDSPQRMTADLLRQSGTHEAQGLVAVLAADSASLVEWLVEDHRVDLRLVTDYKHVGHSVERLHAPPDRRGSSLMKDLLAATRRSGVDIAVGNPVAGLVVEHGEVVGVVVDGPRCGRYEISCRSVVLAGNGFGNDRSMLEAWIPEVAGAQYFGAEGSTGEAVRWCLDLGAQPGNMGAYQGYATVAYPHGSIVSWTTVEKGGVILSPAGERMGDETLGYSGFTEVVSAHATESHVVMDTRIRDYVTAHEPEFADLVAIGGVVEASDVAEVALRIGASADVVGETLSRYQAAARGGPVDEHGRTDFGMAPLQPPYCVVRSVPAIFHTQGGARVDDEGRVVRSDGSPIPGLYAGGGVTAGLSGVTGAAGYSSGNGLMSAIGLGRIAGAAAARRSRGAVEAASPGH
ncbi:MAG TPA: FAD-dependent oxidoreductase [Nocardioidaceae bacterium]|nr:FAD-dependent oxidoreductase [Nocardioidaceae bacterium]